MRKRLLLTAALALLAGCDGGPAQTIPAETPPIPIDAKGNPVPPPTAAGGAPAPAAAPSSSPAPAAK